MPEKNKLDYEILDHPADLKIRAYGDNLPELFLNMFKGMFESCRPIIEDKSPIITRKIEIKASDLESLLINFLSEALYLSDVNNETYFKVNFKKLDKGGLMAEIKGRKVKKINLEIKAVTWHDLKIDKKDNLWQATVLFDI